MGLFIWRPVDATDFRILGEVLAHPFLSNEAVGRRVGLSGTAVKARAERLAREIRFRGYRLVPAAPCLGRVARGHFFRLDAPEDAWVARVMAADPVVWLVVHHEGTVSVLTYERPHDPTPPAALVDLFGGPPLRSVDLQLTADPRPPALSPLDWRVLRALVPDPRRPVSQVAEEAGLARRTAARRRQALVERGCAYATPLWDEAKSAGALLFHLIVVASPGVERRALLDAAGPGSLPYATLTSPPGFAFVSLAASAAHALEAQARAARVPGVREALLNIPVRNEFAQERVLGWVDEEIARWERARRKGAAHAPPQRRDEPA